MITQHSDWNNVFEEYVDIKKLDRIIVNKLIDKIEVSEDKDGQISVYINFKYKNPFIEDIAMYKNYITVGR